MSIASGVRAAANRTPSKVALCEEDRQLTYGALVDRCARVSGVVAGKLELGRGDSIALIAPNCLEYLEIVLGASSAGVAVATLNPNLTLPELEYICRDCQARAIIVHPLFEERARSLTLSTIKEIIVLGDSYEALLKQAKPVPEIPLSEWDPFAIPYTSGTTGNPKGVVLSHRSRVMTFFGMASEYGCYSPDDRCLSIAPLCHGAGFAFTAATIFFGGYCEIIPWFDPEEVVVKLHQEHMTNTFMVPTHFHALFDLDDKFLEKYLRPPVRTIISNAAPLPQPTKEKIVDYFGGTVLHETYGSTEAGIVTNLRPPDQLRKVNCVGLPFVATEVELRGMDGKTVGREEVGELFSRSPYLFNEYLNRPEEMESTFQDGWVSAGDLARRDEEGYLYLVDRKDDMIITGGVNVYPREIEQVFTDHELVKDVAVVGVDDKILGEAVQVYIVPQSEHQLTERDIITFCRGKLAPYKVPSSVKFLDKLPRNANGKLLKRELKE